MRTEDARLSNDQLDRPLPLVPCQLLEPLGRDLQRANVLIGEDALVLLGVGEAERTPEPIRDASVHARSLRDLVARQVRRAEIRKTLARGKGGLHVMWFGGPHYMHRSPFSRQVMHVGTRGARGYGRSNLSSGLTRSVGGDRVLPPDVGEAREVRVGGAQRQAVLDRDRRELGVRYEVAADVVAEHQIAED